MNDIGGSWTAGCGRRKAALARYEKAVAGFRAAVNQLRSLGVTPAERVARDWNAGGQCMLVIGATYPDELAEIRAVVGELPFLVPGIGAQGGDVAAAVRAGRTADGLGMVVNSSRGIIYAGSGADFADAAREAARKLRDEINLYR